MRLTVPKRLGIWLFATAAALVVIAALFVPRIPQPLSYHHFADQRSWLGIPNFGDVASNILFAVFGAAGLFFLCGKSSQAQFIERREKWFYFLLFFGLFLTAFGSAYYHLAPDNARLVWDRLPMTLVFMPLVAAMIGERLSVKLGLWLLPILIFAGLASVFYWSWTETRGADDLRFYAAVQAYAVVAILIAALLPPRYTRTSDLIVVGFFYVVAKVCEIADREIFALGQVISGHTLKHLAAGLAGYWILRMLKKRQPVQPQEAR